MYVTRREFGILTTAALAAFATRAQGAVRSPLPGMPAGAIDCHNHIVGPQSLYPMAPERTYTPPEASVAQLLELRKELGIARNVIVQPSFYGFDNSCLVDALAQLGPSARGVAVVQQAVSDAELQRLWHAGVTGVRLNLATAGIRDPGVALEAIHNFAPRFAPLGWHIQINTNLPIVAAIAPDIPTLQVPVVFDHMGNLRAEEGLNQKGFAELVELVKTGNTWVKLSAPYNLSKRPDWADVAPFAKALVAAGPDKMLWGTNWPHPGNAGGDIRQITPYQVVDNPRLLTTFAEWVPDPAMRKLILVDTPSRLYRFAQPQGFQLDDLLNRFREN